MAERHDGPLHVYDGIEEHDHDIPTWFRWLFYATIAWSGWYVLYYHDGTRLGEPRLQAEITAVAEQRARSDGGPVDEATLRSLSHSPQRIARGAELYLRNGCAVCHGPDGSGQVGPSLRDDWWMHGNDMTTIIDVIANGRRDMPPQKAMLAADEMRDLAAWIAEQSRSAKKTTRPVDPARETLAPIAW